VHESLCCGIGSSQPRRRVGSLAVRSMVVALGSREASLQLGARRLLVVVGPRAVRPLVEALADPDAAIRREAASVLGEIGDPASAHALIRALEDESADVRAEAVGSLIALWHAGLVPLLRVLIERPLSARLREGARHVLRGLAELGLRDEVASVLGALDGAEPAPAVQAAAEVALRRS